MSAEETVPLYHLGLAVSFAVFVLFGIFSKQKPKGLKPWVDSGK